MTFAPPPLKISFLGFNPLGGGYDGRGLIDAGADRTFTSLDSLGALRLVRQHFNLGDRRPLPPAAERPWFDLRVTGYSYGGWTVLQLLQTLSPLGSRLRVRVGLVDPVHTFRPVAGRKWIPWAVPLPGPLSLPFVGFARPAYAARPPFVAFAKNVYQTKGLIARFNNGTGWRMPFRAGWFASQPIPGFENVDVSHEVTHEHGHVEVADKYAKAVAAETFGDG